MFFRSKTLLNILLIHFSALQVFNQGSICAKPVRKISDQISYRFLTWNHKEAPMGLYLPSITDNPLPIVMFLHACHNDPVSRHHWIISALNVIEPCAVFLPTAPETENTQYTCSDWGGTYDSSIRPQMANALTVLDSLINTQDFDTRRQYLYGESMGGEGVYRLLSDFPDRFAGAVTAGGYTENKDADKMAKTPLWIVTGGDDEINPVESNKTIYNSILNAGGTTVKYKEYPDLSHTGGIEQARKDASLLAWLLSQQRLTSDIKKFDMQYDELKKKLLLRFSHGNLQISPDLPQGSIVSLFDLNGQVLFKTATHNSATSVKLPSRTLNRAVLWNVSNVRFSVSGMISLFK